MACQLLPCNHIWWLYLYQAGTGHDASMFLLHVTGLAAVAALLQQKVESALTHVQRSCASLNIGMGVLHWAKDSGGC